MSTFPLQLLFLTVGVVLKSHPQDYWKNNPKPSIIIGTTAHVAYDPLIHNKNFTEEEIVKIVEDSKIGSLNLTEKALEIYGKTKEGSFSDTWCFFIFLIYINIFIFRSGLVAMISDIRFVCPLLVQARSQSNYEFYVVTQPTEKNLATADADIQAILGMLLKSHFGS